MGAAASTLSSASDDHMTQFEQQQHHPKLLTGSLNSNTTTPTARLERRGASASTDGDEGPPQLIDGAGSDSSSVCDLSEEVRKSLMLPTASAQHVGRLRILRSGSDNAGCVVWAVPKSALLAPSPSDPKTPPAPPPADGTPPSDAGNFPTLLLSPTFIVPCGIQVGSQGKDGVAGGSASATTEWQLMLEPMSPAAAGAITPDTNPSAYMNPSSPQSSNLSTPTHYDITAGTRNPHPGFTNSPENPAAQDQGHDSDRSDSKVEGKVQVWKPSIRFVWSPSCSASSTSVAAGSSNAAGTAQAAAALGHHVSPVSHGISDVSSIATTSVSSCSGSINDPADIQMQETAAGSSVVGSSSSSSSSKRQVPENVIKGGDCVPKSERKLLPSSWSIRKKNLAPASYRAAYQAQYGKDEPTAAAAKLAPQAGCTGVALPLAGQHSNGSSGGSSAGGWGVECAGELHVEFGGKDNAGQTASTGFDLHMNQPGGSWGAPFSLCCKQTGSSTASTSNSAATKPNPSGSVQVCVLPCTAAGSTNLTHSNSGILADAKLDDVHFQVDFKQVQLLLAGANTAANTAAHTAVGHSVGSDSGDRVSFEADAAAGKTDSQNSSSSKAHQQHPLGLSPPHTPTRQPSDSQQGIKGVTSNGSSGQAGNGSVGDQEGAVAPSKPLPARQLEAVLLSHSPRMLVIDNFFSPELCTGLMELARDRLVRSRVASGSETPSRTSWGHFFVKDSARHPLILEAEAQIEALFNSAAVRGGYGPLAKVEAIQVVRYHPGEFYHEHYDNRADGPLTRAATILVYLCDTEEGGATSFSRAVTGFGKNPAADAQVLPPKVTIGAGGRGVRVFPVQGRALVFWSKRPNGDEDPNSIHAAETVLEGEKWIATRWMKDNF